MNRPSRNDDEYDHPDWNQSPHALSNDLTTRSDLNGIVNSRRHRDHIIEDQDSDRIQVEPYELVSLEGGTRNMAKMAKSEVQSVHGSENMQTSEHASIHSAPSTTSPSFPLSPFMQVVQRTREVLAKYAKFVGPGVMISVAYIDPGNYATDVAAGASYRYQLLVMVMVSNIFAIYLQALCIKLGSVTGLNLAEMIKAHCPTWLNWALYILGEAAIVATDIAEVIGTAIALNLLFKLPLVAGCAISIVDVLVILFFYNPSGNMRGLRAFEIFVAVLVMGVVVCFCFQLSLIKDTNVGEVFRGYLPSKALIESKGYVLPLSNMYAECKS